MLNLQKPLFDPLTASATITYYFPFRVVYFLDGIIKENTCNVMVDHLQSRVTLWRQYASHVKVRDTSSKIDVPLLILFRVGCSKADKYI